MGKLGILVGAGVGYVLGTRDGRERYEQMTRKARQVWKDPRVQEKKGEAQDLAKQKGSEFGEKVAQKAQDSAGSADNNAGNQSASGALDG